MSHQRKILVIDNDPVIEDVLGNFYPEHIVLRVPTEEEGFALIEVVQNSLELIFMDHKKLKNKKLLEKIVHKYPHLSFIFMLDVEVPFDTDTSNGDYFLRKPFNHFHKKNIELLVSK